MKPHSLWQITVTTTGEAEDAVASLLEHLFHLPAIIFSDAETALSRVSVYCAERPAWTAPQRAALESGLQQIRRCGLKLGSGRVAARRIRREAWAESWRRHFRPLAIGSALLIKPSWSRRRPRKGQAVVVLDPGLSFGTGQHPTTAFCLQQLVAERKPAPAQSLLDLGTGSGILAIAAAKLGYSPVRAIDNDPQAVRAAGENARRNRVGRRVVVRREDVTRWHQKGTQQYDLILANLTDDLLVEAADAVVGRLRPGGTLVLAGVLAAQFPLVQKAYELAGGRLLVSAVEREWQSGVFRFGR